MASWQSLQGKSAFDSYADNFDRSAKREVDFAREYAKTLQAQEGLSQVWEQISLKGRGQDLMENTFNQVTIPQAQRAQQLFDAQGTQRDLASAVAASDFRLQPGRESLASTQNQMMNDFGNYLLRGGLPKLKADNTFLNSQSANIIANSQIGALGKLGGGDPVAGAMMGLLINNANGYSDMATQKAMQAAILPNLVSRINPQEQSNPVVNLQSPQQSAQTVANTATRSAQPVQAPVATPNLTDWRDEEVLALSQSADQRIAAIGANEIRSRDVARAANAIDAKGEVQSLFRRFPTTQGGRAEISNGSISFGYPPARYK